MRLKAIDRRIRLAFVLEALSEAELRGLERGIEAPFGEDGYSGFGAVLRRAIDIGAVPWQFAYEADPDDGRAPYELIIDGTRAVIHYEHAEFFGLTEREYDGLIEASQIDREQDTLLTFGAIRAALIDGSIIDYIAGTPGRRRHDDDEDGE